MRVPTTQLGKNLLHLSEDVAKQRRFLDSHPIGTEAEVKFPGTVKGVLPIPPEAVIVEAAVFVIVVLITGHGIKEGVPIELDEQSKK